MALKPFQTFVRELSLPAPYLPVAIGLKGAFFSRSAAAAVVYSKRSAQLEEVKNE